MRRVVITGMGAISPFGRGVKVFMDGLFHGKSCVRAVPELKKVVGLTSRVGALVPDLDGKEIPRKYRRSMSAMSVYSLLAGQEALAQAELALEESIKESMGVIIGSTTGSIKVFEDFFQDYLISHSVERVMSTLFFQVMNHSCAANTAQALGLKGRILSPSAACATGCQAIGYGYEMIAFGNQDHLLCGGAEEFHPLTAATFDLMQAASNRYNEVPSRTPRPFDRDRDGVVCAEGSGVVLLENLESAKKRNARIFAEIIGFSTGSSPSNIANPSAGQIEACLRNTLRSAGIDPGEVDYVNAHATGTILGDSAECEAIRNVFAHGVPVSSLKGHMGHTMAASGALEVIACVGMIQNNRLVPTRNLDSIDDSCSKVRHVRGDEKISVRTVMKNSFALGGLNSSILFRRFDDD